MNALTDHGAAVQADLSARYGVSPDAVRCLMDAVSQGGGTMAQFSHPELGGMGQWSQGGMTMVGDMFNGGLQGLVSNLCAEISTAYFRSPFYPPRPVQSGGPSFQMQGGSFGSWWPAELGSPSSSGSQNNLSYAIFPDSRRLAVNLGGQVTVYDTGDHMIGGVGQQQSGDASWTFTSQFGTVYLNQLPVVSGAGAMQDVPQAPPQMMPPAYASDPPPPTPPVQADGPVPSDQNEIFAALEKLGSLRDMGILTDDEFAAKKAELLARL